MPQFTVTTSERLYREDTLDAYQSGVERSIKMMYRQIGEPLTVDDLADAAYMSRFHFTRVFSRITSVSPARFIATVRIQEAKRLLLQTDRSITDICFDVGYNSLGTFSRIFSTFVGFSPLRFRQLSLTVLGLTIPDIVRLLPSNPIGVQAPSIKGEVFCNKPLALVTVALFPTAIARSHPVKCVCLTDSRRFAFDHPLSCKRRLFAAGMTRAATIADAILIEPAVVFVGTTTLRRTDCNLTLRPRQVFEPPVLVAFPLLLAESLLVKEMSTCR